MFNFVLEHVTSSPATYAVLSALVAFDAVLPLVPSETVAITAGVLAAGGELSLPLLIAAAAFGGIIGDNISYAAGATLGRRALPVLFRGERSQRLLGWAQEQLHRRPAPIILVARFIPGGRTATTFASGTVDLSWRRFVAIDAVAVVLWATYAVLLGYLGGSAFQDTLWKPLVAGLACAAVASGIAELLRRRGRLHDGS